MLDVDGRFIECHRTGKVQCSFGQRIGSRNRIAYDSICSLSPLKAMKRAFMCKPKMARGSESRRCYTGTTMGLRLSPVLEAVLRRLLPIATIRLEPIPETGRLSITVSGMDARKGGCKDAIESMAVFGRVLGVCGAVVTGACEP